GGGAIRCKQKSDRLVTLWEDARVAAKSEVPDDAADRESPAAQEHALGGPRGAYPERSGSVLCRMRVRGADARTRQAAGPVTCRDLSPFRQQGSADRAGL